MNIENNKTLKVANIFSLLVAISGGIQQIVIHGFLTPAYEELFINMGARLPYITNALVNYNSVYLYFFILILTFLIVKEFIFKDKHIKIILNMASLFLFILNTFFIIFALYLPFMNILWGSKKPG